MPPYIDPVFRERLDQGAKPVNSGELNYCLTRALLAGVDVEGLFGIVANYLGDTPRYAQFNDVVGAVTCCFHEFGRRHAGDPYEAEAVHPLLTRIFALLDPYEDKKRKQNGDVQ